MAEIFAVLTRLNREHGTTIIIVEHWVDELADKVSRVVMMDRGAIVFDGAPRAAFSSWRVVHSEEAAIVPTANWFTQVSESPAGLNWNSHADAIAQDGDDMKRGNAYQFRVGKSAFHRLDPVSKLIWLLGVSLLAFGAYIGWIQIVISIVVLATALILARCARRHRRRFRQGRS